MPDAEIHTSASSGPELEFLANPASEAEIYAMPVSQSQERFWSLDQLPQGNPALNMPLMWQCNGALDIETLRSAFQFCVQRHEALRTTFAVVDGDLRQIVHPEMQVQIPIVDLSSLKGEAQRLESDRITREHAAFRFDLRKGPLLALKLVRFSPQSHLLLVTMHHIICDGISNGVLMRDMVALYEALQNGTTPELPELPIQFADYTVWQREWSKSEEAQHSLDFWRKSIGNDFSPLQIPYDPDAASVLPQHLQGSTGQIETLLVPPDLAARAHALCAREGITFNVFFFSIFCALLSRLTDTKNFTVGSPCANRTEDTENLVGLFMNIQVLRVRLEEASTFNDLLRIVNDWTLAATENQTLPFEELVHDPFFQKGEGSLEIPIFFLYQPSFMVTSRIHTPAGSLQIIPLRSESPGAVFDLMMAVVDRAEEGPRLQLEYNPQLYKASSIQRYLRLFVNLMESAVAAPNLRVEELSLVTPAEAIELEKRWNQTQVDFGAYAPVHIEFLNRAKQHPARIALQCAGETLTYAELAGRASAIARQLVEAGLQPGGLVGLCAGRSPEMVSAMLAVLMAGGAYVPLDPRYPVDRIEHAMNDSGARFVLTDRELKLPENVKALSLQELGRSKQLLDTVYPSASSDLAYIIYTSGSTGVPKGVAIQHGSLMNLLRSMEVSPGLSESDVLVAITTVSFDIAALELLLPLIVGARVVVATENEGRTPNLLLSLLNRTHATVMQATPGAWRALLDEGWTGEPQLKVLCGGEAMSRDLADRLLERSNNVWNMYGPTETTIWSSATRVTPGTQVPRLGVPIANTQFYVMDAKQQLMPLGCTGELCIGGAGLARGYHHRDELTAEKFLPSPFGKGRIYRTGDLARRDDDGSIHLLGRTDFQVKVRGYRIELGEIENTLERHAQVREAVVVQHVVKEQEGNTSLARIIAYVDVGAAADENGNPTLITELEEHLGRSIPDYMMPNVIVALPELPRLMNGKVNRKALPDVFQQAGDRGLHIAGGNAGHFQAPQNALERQLAEMWQTTLGIARISTRASFFSLGIGSLAALRLITKINRVYAMDLGLASLISTSTIESIAALISKRFSTGRTSALVPMKTDGAGPPLFILHGVGGNIINFFGLSRRLKIDQPVYGVQAQALLSGQSALLRLEDMAAYYIKEIRAVQKHGPYYLFGYSFGGSIVFEMAHQLRAAGETLGLIGMLDARTLSFDTQHRNQMTVQTKVERRFKRLVGNTNQLQWKHRIGYIYDKLKTRSIRWSSMAAAAIGIRKMPALMKSAYDINYVAMHNYKPKPLDAHLALFRATEQDFAGGPRDLGWKELFTQGVKVYEIPGDHERIFLEPSLDKLVSQMSQVLEQATSTRVKQ